MKMLGEIFKKYSSVILLLGAMLPTAFLYLTESGMMLVRKIPLNNIVDGVLQLLLVVAAILIWALLMKVYSVDKYVVIITYFCEALIKFAIVFMIAISIALFGSTFVAVSLYAYYVVLVILVLVIVILVNNITIGLVVKCVKGNDKQGARLLRKKLKKSVVLYGLAFFVLIILVITDVLIRVKLSYFILQMMARVIQALTITWYFYTVTNRVTEQDNLEEVLESKSPSMLNIIPIAVAGIGLIYITVLTSVISNKNGIEKIMINLVEEGQHYADVDQIEMALSKYILAADYMNMLQATIDRDNRAREVIYEENKSDDYINALYYLERDGRDALENKTLTGNLSASQRYLLLDYYNKKDELSEKEMAYQQSNIYYCINHNMLVDEDNIIGKMEPDIYKTYKAISVVEKKLSYNDLFTLLVDVLHKTSISDESLEKILEIAEENPDDILYQIVAMNTVDYIKLDDKSSANKVEAAAVRYVELAKDGITDYQEILEVYEYALSIISSLNKEWSNEAKALVEESKKYGDSEIINTIELSSIPAISKGQYEELFEKADEYLNIDPDNTLYLKYYIDGAIGTGRTSEALLKMVHLMELFDDASDEEKSIIFTMITDDINRMTYRDPRSRYLLKYSVAVGELTEDDQKILEQSPLLKYYYNGLSAVNNYNNYAMGEALDNLNKAIEIYPNGSDIYIAIGNLYYRCEMYPEAEEAFEKCLKITDSQNARYHLADCQYRNGKVENAFRNLDILVKQFNEMGEYQTEWFDIKKDTLDLYEKIKMEVQ